MSDEGYEKHAAPESIMARRRKAQKRVTTAQAEVAWLDRLLEKRRGQISRGEWPAAIGKDSDG